MNLSNARTRLVAMAAASIAGAIAGGVALMVGYGATASIRFEMDRDLPRAITGFYPVERGAGRTFAWTGRTADINVPGLNRRAPWVCRVSLLGGRPPKAPLPDVRLFVDGVEGATWRMENADHDVDVQVPPRQDGGVGLTLSLVVSETFRPADDPRDLGVAVDRISCDPSEGHFAMAPWPAVGRAAGSAAVIGAALAAIGLAWPLAVGGVLIASIAQTWPLTTGMAPYTDGRPPALALAIGLGLFIIVLATTLDTLRKERLSQAARIALGISGVLCFWKLLILLHPDMPRMDALFQAHNLERVLGGEYFFTSLTPDGYRFPYGISLYLAAAPFASIVRDHVMLLRMTTCIAEMLAGLCLYGIVSSTWRDRGTAILSLLLFHTTPIAAAVAGTGNLTNAFGESVALMTVALLVALPLGWPIGVWLLVPILVASVAFVAHFSTFMVLALTLCLIGLTYYLLGGPTLQRAASSVLLGLGLATLMSVLLFYGHFLTTYRSQAARLSSEVRSVVAPTAQAPANPERQTQSTQAVQPQRQQAPPTQTVQPPQQQAPPTQTVQPPQQQAPPATRPNPPRRLGLSLAEKFATLGRRTWPAFGWLLPSMAFVGLVVLVRRRTRDRLTLALAGWLLTMMGCAALAVLTPLELRYHLAVAPALTVLSGLAAATGWRARGWRRWTMTVAVTAAVLMGMRGWFEWIL